MIKKIRASLELVRPANIVTAFADILAGFAAVGGFILISDGSLIISPPGLIWLLISTFGLYGGGVVFNDVFDADIDAKERPERAIPSGRISRKGASYLGITLYFIGLISSFQVNNIAGIIAISIIFFTLIYDSKAKHSVFWGPLFMGLCRGGNLLLGISIVPFILGQLWFLAIIPIVYIGAITLVSQGEVKGGSSIHGYLAVGLITFVIASLLVLALFIPEFDLPPAVPFLMVFAGMVLPPFVKAAKKPEAGTIKKAIKRGVISLVILNSVLAAGFSGWVLGLIVFSLFFLSMGVARVFAVT